MQGPVPAHLPRASHALRGGDADLAALDESDFSGARWETVTGLGGSGKTRLALAHAARAATDGAVAWADGRRGVDAPALARELLRACGLEGPGDTPIEQRLTTFGDAPLLLVVDDPADSEAALNAITRLVCFGPPGLRILVTARGELGARASAFNPSEG